MRRSFAALVFAIVLFAVGAGCSGSEEEISVSPSTADVVVGGAPITLTATLTGFSDEEPGMVTWVLEGPGSTTPPVVSVITYTPPTTGGDATATLTATAHGRSAKAVISIHAAP